MMSDFHTDVDAGGVGRRAVREVARRADRERFAGRRAPRVDGSLDSGQRRARGLC